MLTYWFIKHFDPNWRLAHRLWSIRLMALQAVLAGLWMAVPVFQGFVSPTTFACLCVALALAMMVARVHRQDGVPDGL